MGRYLLLLLAMWSSTGVLGNGIHHRLSEPTTYSVFFTDSTRFFIDWQLEYSPEEVRALSDSDYVALNTEDFEQSPLALWTRVQLSNDQPTAYEGFFELSRFIDTVRMYTYHEGKLLDVTATGKSFAPFDKPLAGIDNLLPFLLRPGATRTYYFQIIYGAHFSRKKYPIGKRRASSSFRGICY